MRACGVPGRVFCRPEQVPWSGELLPLSVGDAAQDEPLVLSRVLSSETFTGLHPWRQVEVGGCIPESSFTLPELKPGALQVAIGRCGLAIQQGFSPTLGGETSKSFPLVFPPVERLAKREREHMGRKRDF